jgi:hypothetical protein
MNLMERLPPCEPSRPVELCDNVWAGTGRRHTRRIASAIRLATLAIRSPLHPSGGPAKVKRSTDAMALIVGRRILYPGPAPGTSAEALTPVPPIWDGQGGPPIRHGLQGHSGSVPRAHRVPRSSAPPTRPRRGIIRSSQVTSGCSTVSAHCGLSVNFGRLRATSALVCSEGSTCADHVFRLKAWLLTKRNE